MSRTLGQLRGVSGAGVPASRGDTLNQDQVNKSLESLAAAFRQIYTKNASVLSFEELYRLAYHLVIDRKGKDLYQLVINAMKENLERCRCTLDGKVDSEFLQTILECWQDHSEASRMIGDILMYVDRNYCRKETKLAIQPAGLDNFRTEILEMDKLGPRLRDVLLHAIYQDRQHTQRMDGDVRKALEMLKMSVPSSSSSGSLTPLSFYRKVFEFDFLKTTHDFYLAESRQCLENTVPEYLDKAQMRMQEEDRRLEQCYLRDTGDKLVDVMNDCWIQRNSMALVDNDSSGCRVMFAGDKTIDLETMHKLFSPVASAMEHLQKSFRSTILIEGEEVLADTELQKSHIAFVERLINIKKKYESILSKGFHDDRKFQTQLREAFESFLNHDHRAAGSLAAFLDNILKRKDLTTAETETYLDDILGLFRFLQDKDVFESSYKQYLGKRLLGGRIVERETEMSVISRLKSECGHAYTQKIQGMFNDIDTSEQFNDMYKRERQRHFAADEVDISMTVLSQANWPCEPKSECSIPAELHLRCNDFIATYTSEHSGRRLTWQFSQGKATLKANFQNLNKPRHLKTTTYQMLLLLPFNTSSVLSVQHLKDITKIPEDEFKRHFLSLLVSKSRILVKIEASEAPNMKEIRDIRDTDRFQVNPNFDSKLLHITIPLIAAESKGVNQSNDLAIDPQVESLRRGLVEAAIVRLLKARKEMNHNDLTMEVLRHVRPRFSPTLTLIKQRIENLIERDYVKRKEGNMQMYEYVA